MLPSGIQPLVTLIHYAERHGVPIALLQGMYKQEPEEELTIKEVEFIHTEIA